MTYPAELANRSGLFPTQRGRKRWEIGGNGQGFGQASRLWENGQIASFDPFRPVLTH